VIQQIRRSARRVVFWAALVVMAACGMQGVATGDTPVPPRPPDAVRLASLNVQFIDTNRSIGLHAPSDWDCRKAPLYAAFKAIDADIFALQ